MENRKLGIGWVVTYSFLFLFAISHFLKKELYIDFASKISFMKPHQNLEVWKQSFAIVKKIYLLTAKFPPDERFGLTSQIRRACTSIPVNIAEGSARRSDKELQQFLYIALGSASELDTLLLLSLDLDFINTEEFKSISVDLDSIFRLLLGFINMVKKRIAG